MPSDTEIRDILADRIERRRRSGGIVVGILDSTGRRVVAHGAPSRDDARPVDGATIFEVGSVTKVFTSLLLTDMAQKNEVALDDAVQEFLPAGVTAPQRNGRVITLLDLATQTSGLPSTPTNFRPQHHDNPYADYTAEQLYEFLSSYELPRDPGSQYEYSNLGSGLLGHALAQRAGQDYEALVHARICGPLGMTDTRITLPPDARIRLAKGHSAHLQPVPNWDFQVLAGAGALRSTAHDLLKFLAANLGYADSPLKPAMTAMQAARHATGEPDVGIGIGWHITTRNDSRIIWHNGGTYGYASFVGFDPQTRVGLVALANAFTVSGASLGVDDIALHLLNDKFPLATFEPQQERTAIALDAGILDTYVGRYELTPHFFLTVTREDARLLVEAPGQPQLEIFPESTTIFFSKVTDVKFTFEIDAAGQASRLTVHQLGNATHATRA